MSTENPEAIWTQPGNEALAPTRAKRDGCGCPPWVIRCAHFEGSSLALNDFSQVVYIPCRLCVKHPDTAGDRYSVATGPERIRCPSCHELTRPICLTTLHYHGADLDAALAAFYEAEEALLRGDS